MSLTFEPQDQAQQLFLEEVVVLLQQVERDLQALQTASDSVPLLECLVQAAHLLRCGGAYFRLPSFELVAHRLKGILKVLQHSDLRRDWLPPLLEITGGLQRLRTAYATGQPTASVLVQVQPYFATLMAQLSTAGLSRDRMPRTAQLDQDLIQQVCVAELPQLLTSLEAALVDHDRPAAIRACTQDISTFGEFLDQPQLREISRATLAALEPQPEAGLEIGQLALMGYQEVQAGTGTSALYTEVLNQLRAYGQHRDIPRQKSAGLDFQAAARDWLTEIEQDLLQLTERDSLPTVHNLMRVTHTLKGAAMGANLDLVTSLSRSLEEVLRSLCRPNTAITPTLRGLLLRAYESLRLSTAATSLNEADIHQRANTIFAEIQEHLGDQFDPNAALPTAAALGADVVAAVFERDVEQRLQALQSDGPQSAEHLRQQAEVLAGIAESFDLPGFKSIAEATIEAAAQAPEQATTIAQVALQDFRRGQAQVLAGDRTSGGAPSAALQSWAAGLGSSEELSPDAGESPHLTVVSGGVSTVQTIRVAVEQLERLTQLTGVLLTSQKQQRSAHGQFQQQLEDLQTLGQQHLQQLRQLCEQTETMLARRASTSAIDREQERQCLEQLQAAAEDAAQVGQQLATLLQDHQQAGQTLKLQKQLLADIRQHVLATQVVTLESLFNRLQQVFQQLVTAENKAVDLTFSGADISVERTVAEQLYDPLLHLLRNAFDHGVETPEGRRQSGKPEQATIQLQASQQDRRTVITVTDDGPGLDLEQIRTRAVQLQLAPEQVELMSETELLKLLFTPGFSTRSQADDLSGRGIGLDVVQTQVQQMGGTVAIKTRSQQGTTIELKLPHRLPTARTMTSPPVAPSEPSPPASTTPSLDDLFGNLAPANPPEASPAQPVMPEQPVTPRQPVTPEPRPEPAAPAVDPSQLFIWSSGKMVFTLPYRQIEEHVDPNRGQVIQSPQRSLMWRGQHIPLYPLSEMLGHLGAAGNGSKPSQTLLRLVLRLDAQVLAIESTIDHLINGRQLQIQPLSAALTQPQYVYGQTQLLDGTAAVVIDMMALLRQTLNLPEAQSPVAVRSTPPAFDTPPVTAAPNERVAQRTVLIIDDSRMVRETLKGTLKTANYAILEAKDGQDAIDLAQQATAAPDAVICDVAMPRMNGLDFLRACRQYPLYADAPIMMLSSCSSEVHQKLAFDLGATAYLSKPYSDQQLLSTIANLIGHTLVR